MRNKTDFIERLVKVEKYMHRYCSSRKTNTSRKCLFSIKSRKCSIAKLVGHNGVFDICDQARKGAWGMSWYQKILKGVEDCDMSGEVVKQTLIPEFPNRRELNQ